MRIRVQVLIESDQEAVPLHVEEIACFEREQLTPETLGLRLEEAKQMLASVQQVMTGSHVEAYVEQQRQCLHCQQPLACKGHHQIGVRTLFCKLTLSSPRLYTCSCQPQKTNSWSPVAALFPERSTPELLFQEVRWASLLPYGVTIKLLSDLLPMEHQLSTSTLSRHVRQVAERLESKLGDEQPSFITGCPAQWYELPEPGAPLVVSIDGGYVHARSQTQRKDGSFEIIVGKSITGEGATTRFGLVSGYDTKPRRRLFEVLLAQGLQMNQAITFLTDGGDSIRDLTDGHSPQSTHILDWFHITMRLTVLNQMGKLVSVEHKGEKFEEELERIKWFLWQSNVYKALQLLEWLDQDIDAEASDEARKLARTLHEFDHYIRANQSSLPNYDDRYRNGEPISSSLAESSVNQIISKRFVKKQQMRWDRRGAHLLLQIRTRVLDDTLTATFQRWYAGMSINTSQPEPAQVAS
ncbi:MAG TPA: ISKra4 family transposase [Ktedonobacteraceae bacterium]|nr:ISKra4 family transposase [Ktedonobacteraceae bacterium]